MPINPQALLDLYDFQRQRAQGIGQQTTQQMQQAQQQALMSLAQFQRQEQIRKRQEQQKAYQEGMMGLSQQRLDAQKSEAQRAQEHRDYLRGRQEVQDFAPGAAERLLNADEIRQRLPSQAEAGAVARMVPGALGGAVGVAPQMALKDIDALRADLDRIAPGLSPQQKQGIVSGARQELERERAGLARQAELDAQNKAYQDETLAIRRQEARTRAADALLDRKLKQKHLDALEHPPEPGQLDAKGRADVIRVVKDSANKRIQAISSAQASGQITPEEANERIKEVVDEMKGQMAIIAKKNQDPFYAEAQQAATEQAQQQQADIGGKISQVLGRRVEPSEIPGLATMAHAKYQRLPGIVKMRVDDVLGAAKKLGMSDEQAFAFALKTIEESERTKASPRSEYLLPGGKVVGPTLPNITIGGR